MLKPFLTINPRSKRCSAIGEIPSQIQAIQALEALSCLVSSLIHTGEGTGPCSWLMVAQKASCKPIIRRADPEGCVQLARIAALARWLVG